MFKKVLYSFLLTCSLLGVGFATKVDAADAISKTQTFSYNINSKTQSIKVLYTNNTIAPAIIKNTNGKATISSPSGGWTANTKYRIILYTTSYNKGKKVTTTKLLREFIYTQNIATKFDNQEDIRQLYGVIGKDNEDKIKNLINSYNAEIVSVTINKENTGYVVSLANSLGVCDSKVQELMGHSSIMLSYDNKGILTDISMVNINTVISQKSFNKEKFAQALFAIIPAKHLTAFKDKFVYAYDREINLIEDNYFSIIDGIASGLEISLDEDKTKETFGAFGMFTELHRGYLEITTMYIFN